MSPSTSESDPADHGGYAELQSGPTAIETFLDRHHKTLIALGALVVLGIVSYLVWGWLEKRKAEAATEALAAANDREAMLQVAEDHAGTPAAGSALLEVASELQADGDVEGSVEPLQRFVDQYAGHPLHSHGIVALNTARREVEGSRATNQIPLPDQGDDALHVLAALHEGDSLLIEGKAEEAIETWLRAREKHTRQMDAWGGVLDARITLARAGQPEIVDELPAPSESASTNTGDFDAAALQQMLEAQATEDAGGGVDDLLDSFPLGLDDPEETESAPALMPEPETGEDQPAPAPVDDSSATGDTDPAPTPSPEATSAATSPEEASAPQASTGEGDATTDPGEPTEAPAPEQPEEPVDPAPPTEPQEPSEPAEPQPAEPSEPQPEKPTEPAPTEDPIEPQPAPVPTPDIDPQPEPTEAPDMPDQPSETPEIPKDPATDEPLPGQETGE